MVGCRKHNPPTVTFRKSFARLTNSLKKLSEMVRRYPPCSEPAQCGEVVEVKDPPAAGLRVAEGDFVPSDHAFGLVKGRTDPHGAMGEAAVDDALVARARQSTVATPVPVHDPACAL